MRRQLTSARLLMLAVAGSIAVAGCSSAAPLSGSASGGASSGANSGASNSAAAATGSVTSPSTTGAPMMSSETASPSLSGLTAACSAVIDAQSAIAALFAEPVAGDQLDQAAVNTAFDGLGPNIPPDLQDDVQTLHDAADRAVGESAVDVAAILADKQVAGALAALSDYVTGCTPTTS